MKNLRKYIRKRILNTLLNLHNVTMRTLNKIMDKLKTRINDNQIERNFGKGSVMKLGEKGVVEIDTIPSGSLSLDIALGIGGLPKGRIVEIYGPSSVKRSFITRCGGSAKNGGTLLLQMLNTL